MPNYEIVTMKNKVTVKCANQKMEQDLVITYKDALSSERSLKKLLDYTKSCYHMFYSNSTITDLTDYFEYSDTENVTSMYEMFYSCSNLTAIPQLDTSNVTDMQHMFYQCSKLTAIPQLDTSNVTSVYNMFNECNNLEKIDITSLDKITSTNKSSFFAKFCYSLKKVIIRNMSIIPALNSNAFTDCYHLTGNVDTTYNPNGDKDCYIYVPDNMVESLKTATNWSAYASQIKPLSELVED